MEFSSESYESLIFFSVLLSAIMIALGLISYSTQKPKECDSALPSPAQLKKKPTKKGKSSRVVNSNRFLCRSSILDSGMEYVTPWNNSDHKNRLFTTSIFRGWFNLIVLMASFFVAQNIFVNYRDYGNFILNQAFLSVMIEYLHELVIVITPVYALSFSAYFIQKAMIYQIFGAKYSRIILHFVQHCIQTVMIFGVFALVFFKCQHWPLTQKFALLAETLVLYMKMHSYLLANASFYEMKSNAKKHDITSISFQDVDSLSDQEVVTELEKKGLRDTCALFEAQSDTPNYFCFFSKELTVAADSVRPSLDNTDSAGILSDGESNVFGSPQRKQKKLQSKIRTLKKIVRTKNKTEYLRNVLKDVIFIDEYRKIVYPENITLWDWISFTFFPTLCYEPIYPRTPRIRPLYIIEKAATASIILTLLWVVVEKWILPVLAKSSTMSPFESIAVLCVPMLVMEILCFFLVFDTILNCMAEITMFADRQFYEDWWNCTTFLEFSRKWNLPVHEFLLRHVYMESQSTYRFSRNLAKTSTFVFSIALHEIVISACVHSFRPWLAVMSLMQLPLMPIMRAPAFNGKPLGNMIFWFGMIVGLPIVSVLYARDYCVDSAWCMMHN